MLIQYICTLHALFIHMTSIFTNDSLNKMSELKDLKMYYYNIRCLVLLFAFLTFPLVKHC